MPKVFIINLGRNIFDQKGICMKNIVINSRLLLTTVQKPSKSQAFKKPTGSPK